MYGIELYDDVVTKKHNMSLTIFFNLKKFLMLPFGVILNFQTVILLGWVLLLVQEMHVLACVTQGHMEKLPPCCFHAHNHPAF